MKKKIFILGGIVLISLNAVLSFNHLNLNGCMNESSVTLCNIAKAQRADPESTQELKGSELRHSYATQLDCCVDCDKPDSICACSEEEVGC